MAIPGKVIEVTGETGIADFAGLKKAISLKFTKAKVGEWVICAGDVAAEVIGEEKALEMLGGLMERQAPERR